MTKSEVQKTHSLLPFFLDAALPLPRFEFTGCRGTGTLFSLPASQGTDVSVGGSGINYTAAFAVAPKAHLAIYQGDDNTAFHDGDDAVTVPSYKAVARGVVVCAPAGSSGTDMYRVESTAPWLLSVAASDSDRRVVTNVEIGGGILKPDVSAPGLVSGVVGGSDAQLKAAASVAAARVSGVAAVIKKAHREWSPAAIKSALVTTARPVRTADAVAGDAASYFVTGAGEVDPEKAVEPGLVYDLAAEDFIPYLCGMKDRIEKLVEPANASCAETGAIAAKDLNYPSIMIVMDDGVRQVEAKRTLTNVGEPAETYRVEATVRGVDVVLSPSTLAFT
ncbi:hypothetical protein PR202_ga02254 [Eleusine coracana subsp. coracana]|uniref:Uncharacterized protein n=1 Tax=Eleusine coracana subsp. coracana TaxID=191504 RepID=A0AAV5BJC4_ELECO|nr:hypothetical protein PR202_ga02254 [Eleusine coracana subsp. coracana]